MSLSQWSTTAATNASAATGINFAEGQAPSTLNDSCRQLMADVRAEYNISATVVAAGTTDLSTATGNIVPISGNTTITGLGTVSAGIEKQLLFTGTPTIVHNATSNILPGGATIVAAAGDVARVISEGSGNWRWHHYGRAASLPATLSGTETLTNKTLTNPTLTTPTLGVASATSINFGQTALSYYGEGTWTATLACGTSGTITMDSSFNTGQYVRVGKSVAVTGYFFVTSVSSPAGTLTLNTLPFSMTSASQRSGWSAAAFYINGFSSGTCPCAQLSSGTSLVLADFATGSATIINIANRVQANSVVELSMTYFTS